MKTTITVNTDTFTQAVAIANTFTSRDGAFAGQIVIHGVNGELQVKASDMMQTAISKGISFVSSDLTDTNFAPFGIDGKKLFTALKSYRDENVLVELNDGSISLKSGRSKIKLDTVADVQNIAISQGDDNTRNISPYMDGLESILHAIDTNNPKYELNGASLQTKDGVFSIAATDTKRLSAYEVKTDLTDFEAILPREGVQALTKLFKGLDISIEVDETYLSVFSEKLVYQTKLINGKFPEWQRIVPQSAEQKVSLNKKEFLSLLQEVSIYENEIAMKIANGKIILRDSSKKTEVIDDMPTSGASITVGINSKYVMEFLNSSFSEEVELHFNAHNLPIVLVADETHKDVVMPITDLDLTCLDDEVQNNEPEQQAA